MPSCGLGALECIHRISMVDCLTQVAKTRQRHLIASRLRRPLLRLWLHHGRANFILRDPADLYVERTDGAGAEAFASELAGWLAIACERPKRDSKSQTWRLRRVADRHARPPSRRDSSTGHCEVGT